MKQIVWVVVGFMLVVLAIIVGSLLGAIVGAVGFPMWVAGNLFSSGSTSGSDSLDILDRI